MSAVQDRTSPHIKLEDDQHERGRHRSRSDDKDDAKGNDNGDDANSSQSDGPARKRRRSRKGLDKKYECPQKGCGKSYSRAEHLHRHQLNHTPKQIYSCDYPGCERNFVRQDLCNRHRDRHTVKGSSLNRKENLPTQVSPIRESRPSFGARRGSPSPDANRPATIFGNQNNANGVGSLNNGLGNGSSNGHINGHVGHTNGHAHASNGIQSPFSPRINTNISNNNNVSGMSYSPRTTTPTTAYTNGFTMPANGNDFMSHDAASLNPAFGQASSSRQRPLVQPYQSPAMTQRPPTQRPPIRTSTNDMYDVMSPTITQSGFQTQNTVGTPQTKVFVSSQNFPNFDLPPSNFVPTVQVGSNTTKQEEASTVAGSATPLVAAMGYVSGANDYDATTSAAGEMLVLDQMSMPNTMPMFGTDSIMQKSPHVGLPEDFMAYLFNSTPHEGSPLQVGYGSYADFQAQYGTTYPGNDPGQAGYFPAAPQQIMSVTNLLDQDYPESYVLTEEKSSELFDMIRDRFHDDDYTPMPRRNDSITDGNRNDDTHMLSRRMMEAYIGSYWMHFSDQIPILHKPTFSPERTPNLLLLAMMTIGAACLDKTHEVEIIKAGAELSNLLAQYLRWELFRHANFRPPAKLWVFQALLLLELYEKMFSTRELHERAHIHHATTITLMRRGRSLIGRTAADSPPSSRMNDGDRSSRHSSISGAMHTQDHWWNTWITNEATRRTAFAAFVIDSIHATMFGHSTVMVAHEMRLPLPCDDKLWKLSNGADVGRAEAQLQSEGNRPISFLEGIKKTLSGHEVRTNAFGRTILMAGLLSVSWHMNQRDLQVNSLGGSQALGGRDKWRSTLTRAFDAWKSDYDKSVQRRDSSGNLIDPYAYNSVSNEQNDVTVVFESRVVLHHLAHMATHVDIVDLQIYARAKRLLGRAIGTNDLASAQRRMKDVWAPTAKARDATYYAMQFLCSVLLRNEGNSPQANGFGYGRQMGSGTGTMYEEDMTYSARDDFLLNRPWVLYFAALVVWSYGYATEGPVADPELPTEWTDKVQQMRKYLHEIGSIASPEELKSKRGINKNSAMLLVLKVTFSRARWQLLHEGANLLDNCILLNTGKMR